MGIIGTEKVDCTSGLTKCINISDKTNVCLNLSIALIMFKLNLRSINLYTSNYGFCFLIKPIECLCSCIKWIVLFLLFVWITDKLAWMGREDGHAGVRSISTQVGKSYCLLLTVVVGSFDVHLCCILPKWVMVNVCWWLFL